MGAFVPDRPESHSAKESSTGHDTEFTMASIARDAWVCNRWRCHSRSSAARKSSDG
jgi:hypothetical protein